MVVSITVILAAVVGGFVFIEGRQQTASPPTAVFDIRTCEDCPSVAASDPGARTNIVNVTFESGNTIPAGRLSIQVDDTTVFDPTKTGGAAYTEPANYESAGANDLRWSSDTVAAGERLVLEDDADGDPPAQEFHDGDVVKIVWDPPNGEESFVLARHTIDWD